MTKTPKNEKNSKKERGGKGTDNDVIDPAVLADDFMNYWEDNFAVLGHRELRDWQLRMAEMVKPPFGDA